MIPDYFRSRWEEYKDSRFLDEANIFEELTEMIVNDSRPPFICSGNLENKDLPWILTFGLAPHSKNEHIPKNLSEFYEMRLHKFDSDKMPHQIHAHFARLCCGIVTKDKEFIPDSKWLYQKGYVTFDFVPYSIKDWKWKGFRSNNQLLNLIKKHFQGCLSLIENQNIRFAIFCGKPWQQLLIDPKVPDLCSFLVDESFFLGDITKMPRHKNTRIDVGWIHAGSNPFPAVIIPRSIHGMAAISYEDLWKVGDYIHPFIEKKSKLL